MALFRGSNLVVGSAAYQGAFATAPTTDKTGGALTEGDLYYNTATDTLNFWDGTAWIALVSGMTTDDFGLYLGTATSDPTTDLSGDALTAGRFYLYYNSATSKFRSYDGVSVWADLPGGGDFTTTGATFGVGLNDGINVESGSTTTAVTNSLDNKFIINKGNGGPAQLINIVPGALSGQDTAQLQILDRQDENVATNALTMGFDVSDPDAMSITAGRIDGTDFGANLLLGAGSRRPLKIEASNPWRTRISRFGNEFTPPTGDTAALLVTAASSSVQEGITVHNPQTNVGAGIAQHFGIGTSGAGAQWQYLDGFMHMLQADAGSSTYRPQMSVLNPRGVMAVLSEGSNTTLPVSADFDLATTDAAFRVHYPISNSGSGPKLALTRSANGSGNMLIQHTTAAGLISWRSTSGGSDTGLNIGLSSVTPLTDSSTSCGIAARRWSEVFSVNGTINTSDIRQKRDITDCDITLDDLLKLEVVSHRWKRDTTSASKRYSLIAQNVQEVFAGKDADPVNVADDDAGTLGLNTEQLIPVLVKMVQDLTREVRELKSAAAPKTRAKKR